MKNKDIFAGSAGGLPICAKLRFNLLNKKWQTVSYNQLILLKRRKNKLLPLINSDTLFEKLLQDLPTDLVESAYELKAFTRSRKMKSLIDLLRVVFLYSGLDRSLREVAGSMTLLPGNFEVLELLPTDTKTSGSLANFTYLPGDIVIGDRVYLRRKRILELKAAGVEVVGGFSPLQCRVSDRQGKEIDWRQAKRLSQPVEFFRQTKQSQWQL